MEMNKEAKPANALERQEVVRVKPLVFEEYNLTGDHVDGFECLLRSLNRSQNYFINRRLSDGLFVVSVKMSFGEHSAHRELVEAFKAANEEQQRVILSAIEPTPAVVIDECKAVFISKVVGGESIVAHLDVLKTNGDD